MPSKDQEIAAIAAELDGLLDQLRDNVAALNAILVPPDAKEPAR